MRSILDELNHDLDELKTFVASIGAASGALMGLDQAAARQVVSIRRRFDNAAFTVALYSSFEKYVDTLAATFASLEARRVPYFELPSKLQNKHLQRSADLLSRGRLGEGRFAHLSIVGVVENLFNCLKGHTPYALNEAAVVWHDANLRAGEVDTVFADIGIDQICTQACRGDALKEWHAATQMLTVAPLEDVPRTVIDERLSDLVERRNQITHRGGNPDNLLGADAMNEAIAFINALSNDIFATVVGCYLKHHYDGSPNSSMLEQLPNNGPFRNGTIVVVGTPSVRLFVGQPIYANKSSGAARWGRIQSLKMNDADIDHVEAGTSAPQGVGVGLDFKCSRGSPLVVLSVEDDLIWAPRQALPPKGV